jgi:proline iminopeptidase
VSHLLLVGTTAALDYTDQIVAELQERAVSAEVLTAFLDVAVGDAEFARGQKLVAATLGFHTFDPERTERLFSSTVWSPTACARSRELMTDCNVVSRLEEIEVPTLILAGRHDFFCPPSQADRMHRGIRGSEMVVFEQSGHYPFVEEAERFRNVVRRWLGREDHAPRED